MHRVGRPNGVEQEPLTSQSSRAGEQVESSRRAQSEARQRPKEQVGLRSNDNSYRHLVGSQLASRRRTWGTGRTERASPGQCGSGLRTVGRPPMVLCTQLASRDSRVLRSPAAAEISFAVRAGRAASNFDAKQMTPIGRAGAWPVQACVFRRRPRFVRCCSSLGLAARHCGQAGAGAGAFATAAADALKQACGGE